MNLLTRVHRLQEEGKIHKTLIFRTELLFAFSAILLGLLVYDLATKNVDLRISFVLTGLGMILGVVLFSRISVVNWNEEEEEIQTGRLDVVAIATIALYIIFDLVAKSYIKDLYPDAASVYIIATIFGTVFGRAIGTIVRINKVFQASEAIKN